ncbi:MAG: glycosyltransferase family A protein, partial [Flavobacteriaceae bacterium]
MQYYIIIPAHNEEAFLALTLTSVMNQSLRPKKVIVVNDNSTDATETIINRYIAKDSLFEKLNTLSTTAHMPGSKVIDAFDKGLKKLDQDYDFIVKLDADIILPIDYFEKIAYIFKGRPKVGIAGGFIYEKDGEEWKRNHPMNKDHVRGAFKAYSRNCFKAIGGLKNAMGWDTVDELLAQYQGYEIFTDDALKAKHLRPTGNAYNAKAKLLQGKAMYTMRYGFLITLIASLKMAWKQQKKNSFFDNMYRSEE